ncbi:putative bacteriophage protein [Rhodanobacter fulvus Jip2]|uniref:Putative bacteriophage protein n=1 Tax=Rhodanobacter fulvus Jip2 TaxID=1163408 RepID=I4VMT1_9GAMM|nr:Gp138 family membrane-puncturing spike protein [Rhodanobacter fulvus]EIL88522.1 putative bacteriophage protein [Rhodanobacter fulvus Jip2]
MLDNPQRFDDLLATLQASAASALVDTWTALPGVIVSFDPDTSLAQVQPAIKARITAPDGSTSTAARALLVDVPVCFPGGGGCTLTFPVTEGDECLLVFAARGIDAWLEYGGVQEAMPDHRHAMNDAFAFVGVRSKARKLAQPAASTTQLRSDDGATYVEINPDGQMVNVVAPGGINLNGVTIDAAGNVTSPATVTAVTDVLAGTVSLKTHTHSAVMSGGGTSGPPVP